MVPQCERRASGTLKNGTISSTSRQTKMFGFLIGSWICHWPLGNWNTIIFACVGRERVHACVHVVLASQQQEYIMHSDTHHAMQEVVLASGPHLLTQVKACKYVTQ